MSSILIINANWLGDVLFSTPALRAIRRKYPTSNIACLAPPRVSEVLKRNPHLDELILYDDRVSFLSWGECARVAKVIRQRHFDTAIFFHRSKTKAILLKMAGVPERIGYSAPGRDRFLTQAVDPPASPAHKIDLFLNLIEQTGIPSDGRHMEFFPDPSAELSLQKLLREQGFNDSEPYAVVHAGGNWELKRWPAENFAKSIRLFSREFGHRIILCGTSAEEGLSREIQSLCCAGELISLCGKTSLDELAVLLKNAEFLLSNDSGPIHLAATQKTKIVGLFGPTSLELTGPSSLAPMRILWQDVGCEVPCYYRACNYRVCMDWLTPEEVLKKAKELMLASS